MTMFTPERHLPTSGQHGLAPSGTPPPPPPQTRETQSHSAPTPLKRPVLTPGGGPRPRVKRLGTWTLVRPQKGADARKVPTGTTARSAPQQSPYTVLTWPLHDIVITNSVWCMTYRREVGGGLYTAQWSCNRNAPGWAMQVGGGMQGWLIRAQTPRSKRVSCKGQVPKEVHFVYIFIKIEIHRYLYCCAYKNTYIYMYIYTPLYTHIHTVTNMYKCQSCSALVTVYIYL